MRAKVPAGGFIMAALPGAAYQLKLTGGEKSQVDSLASYVKLRLEEHGIRCNIEDRPIVKVWVEDSATLLAQASTTDLLVVFIIVSLSPLLVLSGGEDEMDKATEELRRGHRDYV